MFANRLKNYRVRYVILLTLGAVGYLIFYFLPAESSIFLHCPVKFVYGIPCPACGLTRASALILEGRIVEAILLNPLVVVTHLLLFISACWMVKDLLTGKETFLPTLRKRWHPTLFIPIIVLLLLNMWWNYVKGL